MFSPRDEIGSFYVPPLQRLPSRPFLNRFQIFKKPQKEGSILINMPPTGTFQLTPLKRYQQKHQLMFSPRDIGCPIKMFFCPIKRFPKYVCFIKLYPKQEVFWGLTIFYYGTKERFLGHPINEVFMYHPFGGFYLSRVLTDFKFSKNPRKKT